MEASRNQNTQSSPVTHRSEITTAEIGQESYSCPELAPASSITSSAVNVAEFECEINDNPKQNASGKKKKKKKKKKKTNPGSSDITSDTINENVQGDHPATSTSTEPLLLQKAEVEEEGSFQESMGTVSSPFQEGEREDIQEGTLAGRKKKRKKKKKKAPETADFDVSVLDICNVNFCSASNDSAPSQALSCEIPVPEADKIKIGVTKDHRNQESTTTDETVSDQQELLLAISTASGENEIGCYDSNITPEYNVQGDSCGKPKKRKKRKKKQEVEYNILSDSESGVVIATGITEIERVNLLQVMPERSYEAGVAQQKSQNTDDAEATTTQVDTQLLGVHDVSATAGNTVELIKPDEESSFTGQSLREERNILCIFKLVYGVGLRSLRKLFMKINPLWFNQPSDAAAFDKWKMKLSKDEETSFNKGNIEEWDFSLMTTALLYSKSCALEMNKRPDLARALKDLKSDRNRLLGHPSTERMSDGEFDTFWPQLSKNFEILGAEPGDIAEIMLQPDEELYSGDYYKQLFLLEQAKHVCYSGERKLEEMDSKLDILIANQLPDTLGKAHISPRDLSGPNWDEWLKFCDMVGDFESHQNQYILVTDSLPPK